MTDQLKLLLDELSDSKYYNQRIAQENMALQEKYEHMFLKVNQKSWILKSLYQKYVEDNEKRGGFSSDEFDFEKLIENIEERLKKSNFTLQAEMNKKIIDKFDQLREYYRVSHCR